MSIETPENKLELIEHCKKRISFLNVNITKDQENILVEKSIKKFLEYHADSTEKNFIAQLITTDIINNKFLITPDNVYEVNNMLSYRAAISASDLIFNDMGSGSFHSFYIGGQGAPASGFGSYSSPLVYYFLAKQSQATYRALLQRDDMFRWNRTTRKLQLIGVPPLEVGKYIVYQADIDLRTSPLFWQNEWLIEYTVNLFKKQWGENLTKFNNVELPGGLQLNGQEIKNEATSRITELEEELITQHANYTMMYIS